jgi:hypothetical protein
MPGLLRVLTPGTGASPRRGVLRALATVGAGSILGGLGAPSAEAKRKGKNKNKNKNKDKTKDRCAECSSICHFKFTLAGGHTTCGNFPTTNCIPCTSVEDCVDNNDDFLFCVTEVENLNTGQKNPFTCGGSPPGVCLNVLACIPLPPLSA